MLKIWTHLCLDLILTKIDNFFIIISSFQKDLDPRSGSEIPDFHFEDPDFENNNFGSEIMVHYYCCYIHYSTVPTSIGIYLPQGEGTVTNFFFILGILRMLRGCQTQASFSWMKDTCFDRAGTVFSLQRSTPMFRIHNILFSRIRILFLISKLDSLNLYLKNYRIYL